MKAQFYILSVSGGTFKNEQGEEIRFGSVMVLDDEIQKRNGFAGQEVRKMRCDTDLIHHIKDFVPGNFDCDFDLVGKESKPKILAAKPFSSKK
jgi:hypothetical protein